MRWFFIILLCLTTSLYTTSAQETTWSVYLYNNNDKTLLRIGSDGTQSTITLDLPTDVYISTWEMAFSPDGQTLAYCTSDWTQATEMGVPSLLTVIDLTTNTLRFQQDLGLTQGCRAAGFSNDNQLLAYATVNYFPDQPGADIETPAWELVLLDSQTGDRVDQFGNNSPQLLVMDELLRDFPIMPEIRDFTTDSLVFLAIPWGIGGVPQVDAYRWHFGTDGNFTRESYWGAFGADKLTDTDEMVWLEYDPARPSGNPGGPIASFNIVQYLAPDGSEQVIYANGEWVIVDSRFVNHGQQIAIMLLESFDPEANEELTVQHTQWILLDRDGTITELGTYTTFTELVSAPAGLVILESAYTQEDFQPPIRYTLKYYVAGGFIDLWTQESDNIAASWQIAYVTPSDTMPDLPPFAPLN
ncbi:MAG: hypothetical protein D6711_17355 [Chloroflexi bacterium]|nr:MAG: hypothetical protein D6711_17355 [Chloroflexota bacterium]